MVDARERIRFDFVVSNDTRQRVELRFPTGQMYDVVVLDTLGRTVWRWSDGQIFTQALKNEVLYPSESTSFRAAIDSVLPPGRFEAVVTLLSENHPIVARRSFDISN